MLHLKVERQENEFKAGDQVSKYEKGRRRTRYMENCLMHVLPFWFSQGIVGLQQVFVNLNNRWLYSSSFLVRTKASMTSFRAPSFTL